MARNIKSEYKEIVKLFDSLTGSRSMWQVFNDCIEMFACALQNQYEFGKRYNTLESRYLDIIKQYSKEEVKTIVVIFSELIEMADEKPFRDLLGDLYMQLDMGSDALGQFFTPYDVAQLTVMVSINIEEVKKEIDEKGYITVNEPSCGGGANIIAFLECLHNNGINYQEKCVVVCQDLSRLTALMCYVVLSLLGCPAVIKVGDTLAKPFTNYINEVKEDSELWTTPMFHLKNCYDKC